MNKTIITSTILLLTSICALQAQVVQENELAIVYYMPQTQIAVTIDYDVVTAKPGMFYMYAERYLGSKDVITEEETQYELTNISTTTRTLPDHARVYKVVAQRGVETQLLALTDNGILYGYNVPPQVVTPYPYRPLMTREAIVAPSAMPLLEEQMMANSVAKMAEGAAKQIYHLRETRLNILAGDVEHAPADGQAMQLVMNELDQREMQLTSLFVGRKTIEHKTRTMYYTPSEGALDTILCRFSRYAGIVANDDLSGEAILMNVTTHKQELAPENTSKKAQEPSQIYYNLPGSADVKVQYKGDVKVDETYPVAQYGAAIPLAQSLFTSKELPHIYFNTQTGNILSIQR